MTISIDAGEARARRRAEPVPLGIKWLYALGTMPETAVNTSINVFLLFYATTVCGIPAALAGAAMAVSLVIDAFVDPLIGSISDNHRSRWGRRLPFMLGSLPVLCVGVVLLFWLPAGLGPYALFAILVAITVAVRISLSCLALPYMAIGAEISDNDRDRDQLLAWRWAAGMVAALMVVGLGFGLFFKGPGGAMARAAYLPFGVALAALIAVTALLTCVAAWKTLDRQHPAPDQARAPLRHAATELREVLRNRNFRILFTVAVLFCIGNGASQALGLHAATYFWKLPADQVQLPTLAITVGLILAAPFAMWPLQHVERRTCGCIALIVLTLGQLLPPTLRLLGLLPLEGKALLGFLFVTSAVWGAALTFAAVAVLSMITQVIDEHELRHGSRREGIYFAGWAFANKAASGLGAFFAGLALSAISFPVDDIKARGAAAALPDWTSEMLGFCYGPAAAILPGLAAAVLLAFRLDRGAHAKIMRELKAVRGQSPVTGATAPGPSALP